MHRNLELQTHTTTHQKKNELNVELRNDSPDEMTRDWISAFNTSLLTTLNARPQDRSAELSRLMQSAEFASLLVAAQHLSDSQGLTMEESTDRLIRTFREMDEIWNQIVIERGLKSIVD
jgi:hypothetical protein